MKKLTLRFKDYSPISSALGSISDEDSKTKLDILQKAVCNNSEYYGDEDRDLSFKVLEDLCKKVEYEIANTKAKDINILNKDKSTNICLFKKFNDEYYTQSYVGVIKVILNEVEITLNFNSRFDTDTDSRFLMYVFEKAFNTKGYIFDDMDIAGNKEKTWDYLMIIYFCKLLKDALKKGCYREYREFEYNDSNVKGRIDFSRHLKYNLPENGRVSYVTREYTVDNPVNTLILKAFSCISKKYKTLIKNIINNDSQLKKDIAILQNDVVEWETVSNKEAIKGAKKKIVHSVYKNYEPLRAISIAILQRMGINSFANSKNSVSGLLISMPGLWEEFLHNDIFSKINNDTEKYKQYEIKIWNEKATIKPDFILKDKGFVFDAKYKASWGETYIRDNFDQKVRDDMFQIMAYMLACQCKNGGIIFPLSADSLEQGIEEYELIKGRDEKLLLCPYVVPVSEDASGFRESMQNMSKELQVKLLDMMYSKCVKTHQRS